MKSLYEQLKDADDDIRKQQNIHVKFKHCDNTLRTINGRIITTEEWTKRLTLNKGKTPFVKLHKNNATQA